ncbi:hypothetical protein SMICM304S_00068 [Streptomyces microflavus]
MLHAIELRSSRGGLPIRLKDNLDGVHAKNIRICELLLDRPRARPLADMT